MRRVLVVDDDEGSRELMAWYLQRQGFSTVTAANGQEALTYLTTGGTAELIVLDLMMPILDGWRFRSIQRADPGLAHIPIIVVSSAADDETVGALEAAATIQKPVEVAAVCEAILNVMRPRDESQALLH
jgi:CheY-like chemotaxis protein